MNTLFALKRSYCCLCCPLRGCRGARKVEVLSVNDGRTINPSIYRKIYTINLLKDPITRLKTL